MKVSERELATLLRGNPDIIAPGTAPVQRLVAVGGGSECKRVIRVTLDYPPSANRYWRHNRGKTHLSDEALAYREHVDKICATAGMRPLAGDVAITLHFFRPIKSGDLDNRFKQVLDALQTHAYHNDSQIVEIHAYRHDDKVCPRVWVEVVEVTA